jgi:hypothetical protein
MKILRIIYHHSFFLGLPDKKTSKQLPINLTFALIMPDVTRSMILQNDVKKNPLKYCLHLIYPVVNFLCVQVGETGNSWHRHGLQSQSGGQL